MNEPRFEIDDVRRCLHFAALYIDQYIGRAVPDDELAEYLLDLVGQNIRNCEGRCDALLDRFMEAKNDGRTD